MAMTGDRLGPAGRVGIAVVHEKNRAHTSFLQDAFQATYSPLFQIGFVHGEFAIARIALEIWSVTLPLPSTVVWLRDLPSVGQAVPDGNRLERCETAIRQAQLDLQSRLWQRSSSAKTGFVGVTNGPSTIASGIA
jgi:hypothetical protein